jgi:hypothetical protein
MLLIGLSVLARFPRFPDFNLRVKEKRTIFINIFAPFSDQITIYLDEDASVITVEGVNDFKTVERQRKKGKLDTIIKK